jgi:phage terminase Nu1 subunit (DNA packaging protein)
MAEYKSQAALAKAVGCSAKTIHLSMKRADWPLGPKPWTESDVQKVKQWRATSLKEDANESQRPQDSKAAEARDGLEIQLKLQRVKKLKFEREVLEGQYVRKDEVETAWIRRAGSIRNALAGLAATVATKFPKDIAPRVQRAVERELAKRLNELCDDRNRPT